MLCEAFADDVNFATRNPFLGPDKSNLPSQLSGGRSFLLFGTDPRKYDLRYKIDLLLSRLTSGTQKRSQTIGHGSCNYYMGALVGSLLVDEANNII